MQPRRTETFKLSKDPLLIDKVRDIVGLYMNPPDHAVVLCVDDESRIQALDCTQPLLPMRLGCEDDQSCRRAAVRDNSSCSYQVAPTVTYGAERQVYGRSWVNLR